MKISPACEKLSGKKIMILEFGAFHLRTLVYLLRTLIPLFAHDSAYHLPAFFTPH